ncbi:MAG: hypothetical protein ACOC84_06900 [Actinomycetota bacterium]
MAYDARTGPQAPQPRRRPCHDSEVNILRMGSASLSLSQSLDRRVFRTNEEAQRAVDRVLHRPGRPRT